MVRVTQWGNASKQAACVRTPVNQVLFTNSDWNLNQTWFALKARFGWPTEIIENTEDKRRQRARERWAESTQSSRRKLLWLTGFTEHARFPYIVDGSSGWEFTVAVQDARSQTLDAVIYTPHRFIHECFLSRRSLRRFLSLKKRDCALRALIFLYWMRYGVYERGKLLWFYGGCDFYDKARGINWVVKLKCNSEGEMRTMFLDSGICLFFA